MEAAVEGSAPATVITGALFARFRSQEIQTFSEKMLSAMRLGFEGLIEGMEPIDAKPIDTPKQAAE